MSLDALKPAALSGLRFAVVNVDTTLPWPLDQRRVERRMRGMGTDTGWSARAGRSVRTEGERA